MSIAIRGAKKRSWMTSWHVWKEEQERLEREWMVIADEPELVNAAFVTYLLPALSESVLAAGAMDDFEAVAEASGLKPPRKPNRYSPSFRYSSGTIR